MNSDKRYHTIFSAWFPVLICAGVIAYFSLRKIIPKVRDPWLPLDKIGHLLAYTALSFVCIRAWQCKSFSGKWLALLGPPILYGGIMELLQEQVGRTFEWGDIVANTIGCFIGGAGYVLYTKFLGGKRRVSPGNTIKN